MRKLILVMMIVTLSACTTAGKTTSGTSMEDFTAREWRLEYNGEHPAIDYSNTTIFFGRDGNVHGNGGCNAYNGKWEVKDGKLSVGPLMSTLMMCPVEAVGRQETRFFQSLGNAESAAVDSATGALHIQVKDQAKPMVFHEVRREATAQGSVFYRERIALSPRAEVIVRVQDVSRADAPAFTIAEQRIKNPGQVPVRFAVEYDPDDIRDGHRYAVRAEIRDNGRLLFTTDRHYPLSEDPIEILLIMAR